MTFVLAIAFWGGVPLTVAAGQDDRLEVTIEGPPPGPHYVGQAIPVRVVVSAGAEEPEVLPPSHPDLDVIAAGGDVRPISAGAIGAVVHETNLYRSDFLLVPRRPGPLLLPAFRARDGDRSGASGPIRLEPGRPPAFGRPSWFLGGVGPLEVAIVAQPGAIRLGDDLVVEVRLAGPGALGSTIRPTLRGLDESGLAPEVEPLPPTAAAEPPSRSFPFRLQPTEAGEATLPPVLVAWFDPGSRTYRTVGSGGVAIRVDDPPRFDPSAIEVAAIDEEARGSGPDPGRIAAVLVAVGATAGLVAAGWRLVRRRRRSARRFASRQARRLAAGDGPRRAELATVALAGYLRRAIGRPEGALTPPEARAAIASATGDPALADRAARLVIACDAARYSERAGDDEAAGGIGDAPALFLALALARVDRPETDDDRGAGDDPRPREAGDGIGDRVGAVGEAPTSGEGRRRDRGAGEARRIGHRP